MDVSTLLLQIMPEGKGRQLLGIIGLIDHVWRELDHRIDITRGKKAREAMRKRTNVAFHAGVNGYFEPVIEIARDDLIYPHALQLVQAACDGQPMSGPTEVEQLYILSELTLNGSLPKWDIHYGHKLPRLDAKGIANMMEELLANIKKCTEVGYYTPIGTPLDDIKVRDFEEATADYEEKE